MMVEMNVLQSNKRAIKHRVEVSKDAMINALIDVQGYSEDELYTRPESELWEMCRQDDDVLFYIWNV